MRVSTFCISVPTVALLGIFAAGSMAADGLTTEWVSTADFLNPESVLHDEQAGVLYVSNVNGVPNEKDGNGYISRLTLDGEVIELKWVEGLDAPKGMAISDGKLYVSDITALVEIAIDSGEVLARYDVPEAKFMNDVAADTEGNVYLSDMADNKLYRLKDGSLSVWVDSPDLENPNGLFVDGDRLIVGSWGAMEDDFSTEVPGHLKSVSLADGSIETLGSGTPVGNLDGVESDGKGNYFVSDWVAGALFNITPDGDAEMLLDLEQGSADIETIHEEGLLIIPMMNENKVVAYAIE